MKKTLLAITLTVICMFLLTGCGSKTIKVQDFIEIQYVPNYNGYATPQLVIDEDGLNNELPPKNVERFLRKVLKSNERYKEQKIDIEKTIENNRDTLPEFTKLFDIEFREDYLNLSNGDEIYVKVIPGDLVIYDLGMSYEELLDSLNIKIFKAEIKFKVKGLEEATATPIDLNRLLTVGFGSYNGYGTPEVTINGEYLETATFANIVESYANSFTGEARSILLYDYSKWFQVKCDKAYNNLSNGDKVKVEVVLNDELVKCGITMEDFEKGINITLSDTTKTYTVQGLEEPKNVIDVFGNIGDYIKYRGANGNGQVDYGILDFPDDYMIQIGDLYLTKQNAMYSNSLNVVYNNKSLGKITYSVKGENLTSGDVIEVTATAPVEELSKLGYIVPTLKTMVTVPELGDYLISKEQLTPAVIEAVKSEVMKRSGVDKIEKLYFASFKPGVECQYDSTGFVMAIIYKKGWYKGYYIDELYDIIVMPDGTIKVEEYIKGYMNEDTVEEAEGRFAVSRCNFELLESTVK